MPLINWEAVGGDRATARRSGVGVRHTCQTGPAGCRQSRGTRRSHATVEQSRGAADCRPLISPGPSSDRACAARAGRSSQRRTDARLRSTSRNGERESKRATATMTAGGTVVDRVLRKACGVASSTYALEARFGGAIAAAGVSISSSAMRARTTSRTDLAIGDDAGRSARPEFGPGAIRPNGGLRLAAASYCPSAIFFMFSSAPSNRILRSAMSLSFAALSALSEMSYISV